MSKTNCVNCGHGKDPDAIKCPFCGTTYFDMTGIDLSINEPVVLMLKQPHSGNVFQMLAFPTAFSVEFGYQEPMTCNLGFSGACPKVFMQHEQDVDVNISFVGR